MKNVILFISMLAVFMLIYSCDENSSKPDPKDPCEGVLPVKADFEMYDSMYGCCDSLGYPTDTVLTGSSRDYYRGTDTYVMFLAKGDYDVYEWSFQDEEFARYGKRIFVKFSQPYDGVSIRLIVKDTSNKYSCRQENERIDTIYKTLTVLPYTESALPGRYLGANTDSPQDTFSFYVDFWLNENDRGMRYYRIQNLPTGCFDPPDEQSWGIMLEPEAGYNSLSSKRSGGDGNIYIRANCLNVQFELFHDTKSGDVIVYYNHFEEIVEGTHPSTWKKLYKTFVGKKVEDYR